MVIYFGAGVRTGGEGHDVGGSGVGEMACAYGVGRGLFFLYLNSCCPEDIVADGATVTVTLGTDSPQHNPHRRATPAQFPHSTPLVFVWTLCEDTFNEITGIRRLGRVTSEQIYDEYEGGGTSNTRRYQLVGTLLIAARDRKVATNLFSTAFIY